MAQTDETPAVEQPLAAPPLELRDGLPAVVDDPLRLDEVSKVLAGGTGPVAIDAERASGYRYTARAYLVQLRRDGAGTVLIDPVPFADLGPVAAALEGVEWIVHAASQDLSCLAELGLRPSALFDTELAGRLLGYPRVGLATLVETVLGYSLRKEHSAVDWSRRPLPEPWLEYAALDVEPLIELRDALEAELDEQGKSQWAAEEFSALATAAPAAPRVEPWRRTSGLHRVRGRRALAAVRGLWEVRDAIAGQRDITPGRILPDSAIVEAANALPHDRASLLGLAGFRGRGAERYANQWVGALRKAHAMDEADLPLLTARYDGPPPPRTWADKDPVAAARLARARAAMAKLSEQLAVPVENLLSPDLVRRLMWDPPDGDGPVREQLADRLTELGARPWQVELAAPLLTAALTESESESGSGSESGSESGSGSPSAG